jgi:uncharacterized protein YbaP (TraB family)
MSARPVFFASLLSLVALAAPAIADPAPPSCVGGVDLVAKTKAEEPEKYAQFERDAQLVPNAEGLLWRIEAQGVAPSYLFGTMHSTELDLVALSEPVKAALAEARTVAVELADAQGAATQAEMVAYVSHNALDFSGRGLDGLTPEQVAEVERRIAEAGMPASVAASLKPWFLGVTLGISACEMKRMGTGLPTVDATVEAAGRDKGARIVGLETVTEQLDAVSKISDETARRMIRDAVATPGASDDLQATSLALYRGRRVGWYFAMKEETMGEALDLSAYADFMEGVVDRRNALMAERSKPLIEQGAALIAVGALHLPGANGLVEIFRQQGFAVTRVW